MANMSYISVIERYHEYQRPLEELLTSIITGIADIRLLTDNQAQEKAINHLCKHYPFFELLFTMDLNGIQTSGDKSSSDKEFAVKEGKGKNRCQRPYYQLVKETEQPITTQPYLSSASKILCISTAMPIKDSQSTIQGYLVIDIDLAEAIEYLMGDTLRKRFEPFFKYIYSIIVIGLFCVVAVLLFNAFSELAALFDAKTHGDELHLKPFSVIIFLTLALAIFDLGKTTLEEEVLMHKDIFRHSSTRRTITRFMAAILIAVSIEALLLMFKAALGDSTHLIKAVWMMFASVSLLVGLGVYVYLGAKAERYLLLQRYPHLPNKQQP